MVMVRAKGCDAWQWYYYDLTKIEAQHSVCARVVVVRVMRACARAAGDKSHNVKTEVRYYDSAT